MAETPAPPTARPDAARASLTGQADRARLAEVTESRTYWHGQAQTWQAQSEQNAALLAVAEARAAALRAALIAECYWGHPDGCGGDRRCASCRWLPYLAPPPAAAGPADGGRG